MSKGNKEKTNSNAKDSDLELAFQGINKKFGEGALMRLGDATKMNVSVISTGSLAIDLALGAGGLPRGRIVEIYGPESSGKTTFCLSVIAEAQRKGGNAVFVDVEHALDPRYAKIVGVDLDNLMVSQPESGEDALNITETLIRSGAIDVIVVDSVAALVSRQELDGQMGDTTVGLQARMMSQAMRRLTAAISKTNCVVYLLINREKIGVMFGSPETTPGNGAKFFCSIRMDIRRIGQIKETNGTVTGSRTRLKVVKNKIAPPLPLVNSTLCITREFRKQDQFWTLGIEHNILSKKGAWISFEGDLIGQGREAAKQALAEDSDLLDKITSAILEKVQVTVGAVLAQGQEDDT